MCRGMRYVFVVRVRAWKCRLACYSLIGELSFYLLFLFYCVFFGCCSVGDFGVCKFLRLLYDMSFLGKIC